MKIGIGAGKDFEKVQKSISRLPEGIDVLCYTTPDIQWADASCTVVHASNPEHALIDALKIGDIDAAVRGTLPASSTLGYLKREMGVETLQRIALLETVAGVQFLLAPVGVDEGWTIAEKVHFIERAKHIAKRFGINPRVAVLSGGRLGDIGRHHRVDASLAEAELVARLTGSDHMEILIEDAIMDHGILIAPDGITGNLIFRTLVFLGGGIGHGAPVVNIDKLFVDTSRASPDYSNAILLAAALVKA
jgi:putative methanogen marker protein 4